MLVKKPNAIMSKTAILMLSAFLGEVDVPIPSDSLVVAWQYFAIRKECPLYHKC